MVFMTLYHHVLDPQRDHKYAGGGYSEPVTPRDEGGWAKGQFEHKCLSIMQSCWTEFGEFIIYFNEPVSSRIHCRSYMPTIARLK